MEENGKDVRVIVTVDVIGEMWKRERGKEGWKGEEVGGSLVWIHWVAKGEGEGHHREEVVGVVVREEVEEERREVEAGEDDQEEGEVEYRHFWVAFLEKGKSFLWRTHPLPSYQLFLMH